MSKVRTPNKAQLTGSHTTSGKEGAREVQARCAEPAEWAQPWPLLAPCYQRQIRVSEAQLLHTVLWGAFVPFLAEGEASVVAVLGMAPRA